MAVNVLNAGDMFGWYSVVHPQAARTRIPVNSPMDTVLTHEHPFTHRLRAGPVTEPMKITDLISVRQWRDQPAYERMRYLTGGAHHMVIHLPRAFPYSESVSVVRADRDYDPREMELASRLQVVIHLAVRHLRHVEHRQRRWGPLFEQDASNAAAALGVTARERDVLDLLGAGATAAGIGAQLGIAPRTVYKHEQNVYRKLGVTDALNCVLRARRLGLLPDKLATTTASGPTALRLTRREEAVLQMLATGMSNREMADALMISAKTIDVYVGSLLRKLDSRTRTQAVATAFRAGLLA